MKLNSTQTWTAILLTAALGLGLVSGLQGYKLGYQALGSVRKPEGKPEDLPAGSPTADVPDPESLLVSEEEVLARVQSITSGKDPSGKGTPGRDTSGKDAAEKDAANPASSEQQTAQLPVQSEAEGVTFAVTQTNWREDAIALNVSLTNAGESEVELAYSTLDVRDERGRAVSAVAEGLPRTLPATGETFQGTVEIPTVLLADVQALSIALTDTTRDLRLQLTQVPVAR